MLKNKVKTLSIEFENLKKSANNNDRESYKKSGNEV